MKFAIIGTNFISDSFVEAAKRLPDLKITAVYSRAKETGEAFASKHGIEKAYCDYDRMLEEGGFDAVYVASPTLLHAEHSVKAMEAGYHVLCEKMMAATLDGFYLMKSVTENSAKVLLEAMRPSFDPAYARVIDALVAVGSVRRADLRFCQYSSRYDRFRAGIMTNAFDPKMKNSALSDIGIYPLNIALTLFGAPISHTSSSVLLHNGFEGEGTILLGYEKMLATLSYSKITEATIPSVIEGEDGSIIIDKLTEPANITLKMRDGTTKTLFERKTPNNMTYEIEAFVKMCKGEISHLPYLKVTEQAQLIVDSVYKKAGIDKYF